MLGLHILVAIGLAAFAKTLTPLGVLAAFALVHLALRLGADLLRLRRYVRRLGWAYCSAGGSRWR